MKNDLLRLTALCSVTGALALCGQARAELNDAAGLSAGNYFEKEIQPELIKSSDRVTQEDPEIEDVLRETLVRLIKKTHADYADISRHPSRFAEPERLKALVKEVNNDLFTKGVSYVPSKYYDSNSPSRSEYQNWFNNKKLVHIGQPNQRDLKLADKVAIPLDAMQDALCGDASYDCREIALPFGLIASLVGSPVTLTYHAYDAVKKRVLVSNVTPEKEELGLASFLIKENDDPATARRP